MVAVGMMAMNIMVYSFTLLSAHVLEPASFGGLGAVLAVLIVVSVGALALQATAARTIATTRDADKQSAANDILASTRAMAIALGVLLLILSPVVEYLLDVPWSVALMLPLAVVPLTLLGGFAGVLQGSREWRWLTAVFLALGFGRLALGGIALLIDTSLIAAVAGLTAGAYLPALVGGLGCRRILGVGTRLRSPTDPRGLAQRPHVVGLLRTDQPGHPVGSQPAQCRGVRHLCRRGRS